MDLSKNSDAVFDAYWEEEARNPHRNRIRLGRQYQATIQPRLKPGESDKRRLEDLETLSWCPSKHQLNNEQLDEYFRLAKALSLYARAMEKTDEDSSLSDGLDTEDEDDETTRDGTPEKPKIGSSKIKELRNQMKTSVTERWSGFAPGVCVKSALKDLADFVTAHHPEARNAGCDVPTTSIDNKVGEPSADLSDWSLREAHLFAKALEVCGKNFSAIKKTFLPWKPVKSIIEYYYKGSDNDDDHDEEPGSRAEKRQFLSVNSNKTLLATTKQNNSCSGPSSSSSSNGPSNKDNDVAPPVDYNKALLNCNKLERDCANGAEIKPLRAKPILPSNITETSTSSASNMGSLKFFMDGQLVLKLNAKQQMLNKKCQWVEAQDTPKNPRPQKRVKKHYPFDHDNDSRSSKILKSDDMDDASESSIDDSVESSESTCTPFSPTHKALVLANFAKTQSS